jgi:YggT family protein
MAYFINAAVFLIETVFDFFIGVFLVRALLIAVNASFYDPICQFVYKITNPLIMPIRAVVPRWRKIEIASLLVALLLALIELGLFTALAGARFSIASWLLGAVVAVLNLLLWILFWAILIRSLLSFFVDRYHSNAQLLTQLTEPIVRPFRRLLPPIAGLDFSLWFASLALILARMLILAPLSDLAARL